MVVRREQLLPRSTPTRVGTTGPAILSIDPLAVPHLRAMTGRPVVTVSGDLTRASWSGVAESRRPAGPRGERPGPAGRLTFVTARREGGTEAMDHRVTGRHDVLLDYLRLRGRRKAPRVLGWPEGPEVRTCRSCGRRAPVRLDREGGWAWCSACGGAA